MRHGMYWSGDLAYRDADGYVYLAGRTADWMRVDGENLAAAPIERILQRHPAVNRVAVYAVPDEQVGDQVMAAVVLNHGAKLDEGSLESFLAEQGPLPQGLAALCADRRRPAEHRDEQDPQAGAGGRRHRDDRPGAGPRAARDRLRARLSRRRRLQRGNAPSLLDMTPRVRVDTRTTRSFAAEVRPHERCEQWQHVAHRPRVAGHVGTGLRPGEALEVQQTLSLCRVHPVDDEPGVIVVGLAGQSGRQSATQADRLGQRQRQVTLVIRCVSSPPMSSTRPEQSAVRAATQARATSRASTVCTRASRGSTASKKSWSSSAASFMSGKTTAASRSSTQSTEVPRTASSPAAFEAP